MPLFSLQAVNPDPDLARSGVGYDPQTTSYSYDPAGRLYQTTQPDGGVVTNEYFPTGQLKKTAGARVYPQAYTYDSAGRIKTLTTWQNYAGNSGQAVTTWNYDPARGWLVSKLYADQSGPSYTYFASGRLKTRTWARGVTATYTWNNAADLASVSYSDATVPVSFTYDRVGRLLITTDAGGTLTRSYHTSGQLQNETYGTAGLLASVAVNRTFDSLDRLSSMAVSPLAFSASYGYDTASRLKTVTMGQNSATYGYLPNAALVQNLSFKSSSTVQLVTTSSYDNLNRLSSISHAPTASSAVSATYELNAANQRTRLTREDGAYWDFGYNAAGEVNLGTKKLSSGEVLLGQDYAYLYDGIGNRQSATTSGAVTSYTTNSVNEVTQRTVPSLIDVYGTADPAANVTVNYLPTTRQADRFYRLMAIDNSTQAQYPSINIVGVRNNAGANGQDVVSTVTKHALVVQNPESFSYDQDGNLSSDGRWSYSWDGENRLISMETQSSAVTAGVPRQKLQFVYDAQGRRLQKTVANWNSTSAIYQVSADTRFIYDGWNLPAELDGLAGNTTIRTYVWGLDLSGSAQGAGGVGGLLLVNYAGATYATGYDGNGNLLTLVNLADGNDAADFEYDPFGNCIKAYGLAAGVSPFKFSTKYSDTETGFAYYGFRFYNPSTGRWLSRDPSEEQGGENLCGFCGNDSVNYVDPKGKFIFSLADFAWTVAKAAVVAHMENYIGGSIDASILSAAIIDNASASGAPCLTPFKTKPLWGDLTDDSLTHVVRDALIGKGKNKLFDKIKEMYPKVPAEKLMDGLDKGYDALTAEAQASQEWTIFPKCNAAGKRVDVFINAETKVAIAGATQSVWTLHLYDAQLPYNSFAASGASGGLKLSNFCCGCK